MKKNILDIKNNVILTLNANSIQWNMKKMYNIDFKDHQRILINKCAFFERLLEAP